MSVIVITGIPAKWSLKAVLKHLANTIRGYFEALNFANIKSTVKDCYIRLSPKLDPVQVVKNINNKQFGPFNFEAFIPDHVPDIALSSKPQEIPKKLRRKLNIQAERIPQGILNRVHMHIMAEMQHKYPGLFPLLQKTNYELYKALSEIVRERLLHILETNAEARETCFVLSKFYRRSHPHFADFQLILSTLHDVEQAAGLPRTQLSEQALSAVTTKPLLMDNLPVEKVKAACAKYSKKIINKVVEHIDQLDVKPNTNDTEEEAIRKKVREELKKMSPFVPEMIRQVITNNFVVPKQTTIKMCLYGEPFLPNKNTMKPFLKSYHAQAVARSKFMYNMIKFEVLPKNFDKVMTADGILLDCGAKLLVRPLSLPVFKSNMKGRAAPEQEPELDEEEYMDVDVDEDEY